MSNKAQEAEDKKKARVKKLDELTDLILEDLLMLARNNAMTASDRKLILDFLTRNGLDLDPRSIPDDVKALLTSNVAFDEQDEAENRERQLRVVG